MNAITGSAMSQFAEKLRNKGLEDTTIGGVLRHLRAAFRFAVRVGIMRECPPFKVPKVVKRKLWRSRAITDAEFAKLLEQTPTIVGKKHAAGWRRSKLSELDVRFGARLERLTAEFVIWSEAYIAKPIEKLPAGKGEEDFSGLKLPRTDDQQRLWVALAAEHRIEGKKRPDTQVADDLLPTTGRDVLRQLKTLASTEKITHWGLKNREVINR